ncbi:lasso peptide biosynthesis PqqD family chaperone [Paenibacillus sp. NPDC056579]|uniref:lasso peptide biosynthesis PqqD family chaperone n=1 Tax=unclassified Paenibacillus TaxID=185978 RepID=UPI001EF8F8C4|nr:lasso peptide biosynthesis PqqD family chaperone [Paenibacillus sp. H1-7]ULL13892.1 lasso peptide biosynthesis PqqD family chaperone [Paenibacillus sp. H1-7]
MHNTTFSLQGWFVQSKGNIVSDMGGEKVMLSVHNGKYYNLGEIGGKIWELLEHPTCVTEMVAKLMSEYEVEHDQCEEHVLSFLQMLSKENLIEAAENHDHA